MVVLTAVLLGLAGCQSDVAPPPPPVVTVAPPPPKPARVVRAPRPKPACPTAAELTAQRKQALFRQFAALQDGATDTEVAQAAPVSAPPAALQSPACRNAAR